jgi:hypothetical protein
MKRLLLFCMLMVLCSVSSRAGIASLFDVDEAAISTSFEDLNMLESFLAEHENATMEDVALHQGVLFNKLNLNMSSALEGIDSILNRPPLGINSFIWGLCLNWVGVVVVYVSATDADATYRRRETTRALIGCGVNAIALGGCTILSIFVPALSIGLW